MPAPHTLRHTAATLALTGGVPVHIVAARLGDNPTTVLSTYATCCRVGRLATDRIAVPESRRRRDSLDELRGHITRRCNDRRPR